MRTDTPLPIVGGDRTDPYPDDANGARWLDSSGTYQNIFASAQKLVANAVFATNPPGTINVCRGSSVSITITVGDNGTTNVTGAPFRMFLATGPYATSGTDVWTGTTTSVAGTYFTQSLTFVVPNVAFRTYWVRWQVDKNNNFSETDEWDNAVHRAMTLSVQC